METRECLLARRSIRKYAEKKVSREQIKDLLEAAMAAPSAMNTQPWEFFVIESKQMQQEIKEANIISNYDADVFIVVAGDRNNQCGGQDNGFWIQDCSAAIENLLLEATNIGLGAVWCGVYPRETKVAFFKQLLRMPENLTPVALIQVGYPAEEKEARTEYDESKVHII